MNQGVTMRRLALTDDILMKIEKPARYIGNGGEFSYERQGRCRYPLCDVFPRCLRNIKKERC